MWEKRLLILVGGIFATCVLGILLLLSFRSIPSVVESFPTPTGYEDAMYEARLKFADLPKGYRSVGPPSRVENTDGFGLTYTFYPIDFGISTRVSQDLIVFGANKEADQEFINRIKYYQSINLELVTQEPKLNSISEGKVAVGCRPPTDQIINGKITSTTQYCVTVNMYQNVISVVSAHVFTNQLLTMDKYQQLIETLNHRILTAFGQSKQI